MASTLPQQLVPGGDGTGRSFEKWARQLQTLLWKNSIVLQRRRLVSLLFILIPLLCVPSLTTTSTSSSSASDSDGSAVLPALPSSAFSSVPLDVLVWPCTIVYAPKSLPGVEAVMQSVAAANRASSTLLASGGVSLQGFDDSVAMRLHVAGSLGRVQYAVTFLQDSLWQTSAAIDPQAGISPSQRLNYVIFANSSQIGSDTLSQRHSVHVPLLTLQRQIDHGILKFIASDEALVYDVAYSTISSYDPYEPSSTRARNTSLQTPAPANTAAALVKQARPRPRRQPHHRGHRNLQDAADAADSVPSSGSSSGSSNSNTTSMSPCSIPREDLGHVGLAVTWAFCFGLLSMGVLVFQLVVEGMSIAF